MWSEINETVEDGNLNLNANDGTGKCFKIGVSPMDAENIIKIKSGTSVAKVKELLGNSPLADSVITSLEFGAPEVYCVPVSASEKGKISDVTHTGTGLGMVGIEGTPQNLYTVYVHILESGAVNEASFRYTTDGGVTYSEEATIPLSKKFEMEGTGLTLTFEENADSEGVSFVSGDIYGAVTTAPKIGNKELLEKLDMIGRSNLEAEAVHIVGESDKVLWSVLSAEAEEFEKTFHKPIIFVAEARGIKTDETLAEYIKDMVSTQKSLNTRNLCVCAANMLFVLADGRTVEHNGADIICGMMGAARQSQSIGEVKSFSLPESRVVKLLPDGIEEHLRELNDARYTVFRRYNGLNDYYVASANVMSREGSDFRYVEDVRVLNRIIRDVRKQALEELQVEIDPEELEPSLEAIKASLNIAIDNAVDDKVISSGTVDIDTDNFNIMEDEMLGVRVRYVGMRHARGYDITFSVTNPMAKSEE